ncbi:MAG TPA: hypothetical protein VIW94_07305 [Acidimicrobiia bacterium]
MSQRKSFAALAVVALILAACGSGNETTTTGAAEEPDTTSAETMTGIHTIESDLGTILVDGEGFVLYAFTVDTEGVSTCYEGCVAVWPPVAADSEIGSDLDASIFGSAARTDGGDQLTANGQPLYRYTPDANPGDTGGQGVNGVWFVVDASGNIVGGPEANSDSTTDTTDDGYDY